MPEEIMVILIIALACGTAIATKALDLIFGPGRLKKSKETEHLEAELSALRQDVSALKEASHDVVLSFESTLSQMDARLQSVERRALTEGRTEAATLKRAEARPEPEAEELRTRV